MFKEYDQHVVRREQAWRREHFLSIRPRCVIEVSVKYRELWHPQHRQVIIGQILILELLLLVEINVNTTSEMGCPHVLVVKGARSYRADCGLNPSPCSLKNMLGMSQIPKG